MAARGEPANGTLDDLVRHGAYRAQLLGDDEVGRERGQSRVVQTVERRALMDARPDVPVDSRRVELGRQQR